MYPKVNVIKISLKVEENRYNQYTCYTRKFYELCIKFIIMYIDISFLILLLVPIVLIFDNSY